MFKNLISKFMAKTLAVKILIATSTIVVVGGVITGAILVPKYIEKKQEEERQEQIRQENEADLANISINLKKDKYEIPWMGVTQGITIERYENLENVIPFELGNEINKEEQKKVMAEMFIENYTGGELSVEVDSNLCRSVRGDYNITFTVTSEKGNTKSATGIITVWNFYRPNIIIDQTDITVTKGTEVDIMQGVTIETNLSKEEQGEIKTEGTVDVNTVGTYTITYTYTPKEGLEGEPIVGTVTRTYRVIEPLQIQQNVEYELRTDISVGTLIFKGNKFERKAGPKAGGLTYMEGTYTVNGGNITFKSTYVADEAGGENYTETFTGKISNGGKTIIIESYGETYNLK